MRDARETLLEMQLLYEPSWLPVGLLILEGWSLGQLIAWLDGWLVGSLLKRIESSILPCSYIGVKLILCMYVIPC